MSQTYPDLRSKVFGAIQRAPLDGWEKARLFLGKAKTRQTRWEDPIGLAVYSMMQKRLHSASVFNCLMNIEVLIVVR